jgi:hypothetical protein
MGFSPWGKVLLKMEIYQRFLKNNSAVKWLQRILSLFLILACALCFLKYLGWAWLVSGGMGGNPSQFENIRLARQLGMVYFCAGLLAEGVLVANIAFLLKFDISDLTGLPKALIRIATALVIAMIGTLGMMLLLNWIGQQHH